MQTDSDQKYPELEKMKEVSQDSQTIGHFIEDSGYTLGVWEDDKLVPVNKTIEQILADYYAIDLKKVEEERQELLKTLTF